MLIIYAIRATDGLIDLYFKEDSNLVWFGCLSSDTNPNDNLDKIYGLVDIVEPEYAAMTLKVIEYERKK